MKRIAILGSTGSIGKNALEVINLFPDRFKVVFLSANSNVKLLEEQALRFSPECISVCDKDALLKLKGKIKGSIRLVSEDAIEEMLSSCRADLVVLAISGSAALRPLLCSINAGCDVAMANKEALVCAGEIIMARARSKKIKILPVDSEQSAIWQCLEGEDRNFLKKVYLTASGGPFLEAPLRNLKNISVEKVLAHPRWNMGRKISVDSATLVNKGLEVIEAMHLFGLDVNQIKVLIHPQAIVHSMVEFVDGSLKAQASVTDMRIPIQYALSYPERLPAKSSLFLDFYKLKELNFDKPDLKKFPCLGFALEVAKKMGNAPCIFSAASEKATEAFLEKRIGFLDIPKVIEYVLSKSCYIKTIDLGVLLREDAWAKETALAKIERIGH
ncbi:MAG: 1-deoxy-D-xylulose-5-phosphate reductoisomerase [Candidatus Omnitrophica bacterium]|jgi:1-deoxy-D-xylulose-5-phosphate reductoisomerase|nr:1-deoxy-D-xylulose-5-phosphate reductoisomerase [Candidatus Omnitrophota bacterium]